MLFPIRLNLFLCCIIMISLNLFYLRTINLLKIIKLISSWTKNKYYILLCRYTFDNKTIYKNIKPVKQGSFIHFRNNNKVIEREYFSFNKKTIRKFSDIGEN